MHRDAILLCLDLEGLPCVVGEAGRSLTESTDYRFSAVEGARTINAAAEAIFEAGDYDVWVWDSHDHGLNLDCSCVDERCTIINGQGEPTRMSFVNQSVVGAYLIGYHSMEGTRNGVLAHTYSSALFYGVRVGGRAAGELYCDALILGEKGIPVIGVVSDDLGCAEAQEYLSDPRTVVTKRCLSRNMAVSRPRNEVYEEIRRMCRESTPNAESFVPVTHERPISVALSYQRADMAALRVRSDPRFNHIDAHTIEATVDSLSTVF